MNDKFTKELAKKIAKLSMSDQVALAKSVRAQYVNDVRNTEAILKPQMLRKMDAKIAEAERRG